MSATFLQTRYEERDQVKSLGARWDRTTKSWFVPEGEDIEPFRQWLRTEGADPHQAFSDELRKAGFRLDGPHPIMDGKLHRIPVDGDKGSERNGTYRGFLDGVPNGWHQNFKTTGKPIAWKVATPSKMTVAERSAVSANLQQAGQQRDQLASHAARRAAEILSAATPAVEHPYLSDKQVKAHGLYIAASGTTTETEAGRQIDVSGKLLIPIRGGKGAVTSLQLINDAGRKMFLRGGKIGGGQHVLGNPDSPWPLHIAEGYATAATIHKATGHAVVVAFTAHNLGVVAAQYRAAQPDRSIFIVGDNDHHLPLQMDPQSRPKRNVGLEAATAAAAAVDGYALVPKFEPGSRGTDWNDAMRERGMAAVQLELAAAQATGARQKIARDIAHDRGYGRTSELARGRNSLTR